MKIVILPILILLLSFSIFPQEKETPKLAETGADCLKAHGTNWDFYNSIRFVPFIKVLTTDREMNLIYFRYEDKKLVFLGSLKMIPEGTYPANFEVNLDQMYVFIFCEKHLVLWKVEKFVETKKPKNKQG